MSEFSDDGVEDDEFPGTRWAATMGDLGAEAPHMLLAGLGIICRTEPAEIVGVRWEPVENGKQMSLGIETMLCYQVIFPGSFRHTSKPAIFNMGHKRTLRKWRISHFWKLSQITAILS